MARTLPSWSTGPPQVVTTAGDCQEHLVEVPLVAGSGLAAAQAGRVGGSELGAPLPDRLVRDYHADGRNERSNRLGCGGSVFAGEDVPDVLIVRQLRRPDVKGAARH